MVVLLMSQWAIDRPAEAAAVAEDKVEWRDSSDDAVSYYSTGGATSTATFWIKDGALETTPAASTTWSSITTSIADASTLTLGTGAISGAGASATSSSDASALYCRDKRSVCGSESDGQQQCCDHRPVQSDCRYILFRGCLWYDGVSGS